MTRAASNTAGHPLRRGPARTRARIAQGAALILALCALAPRAAAEKRALTVAILPLFAAEPRMEIYGKPVADALARELRAAAARLPALELESLSADSVASARVDLVIDGRIVTHASGAIALEAQVRDPARGVRLARVTTEPGPLTDIDELTRALGERLVPRLARAIADRSPARTERQAEAQVEAGAQAAGQDVHEADQDASGPAARAPVRTRAPRLAVFGAVGEAAGGAVPVEPMASQAARRVAAALGYEPVTVDTPSLAEPDQAVAALRRAGASLGIMMHVKRVDFAWYGVLAARGTVRVILIDDQGRALHDRTHRTGTVVGSRGDRHVAVVGFVMSQVGDIILPRLRARVAPAPAAPGRAP